MIGGLTHIEHWYFFGFCAVISDSPWGSLRVVHEVFNHVNGVYI